MIIQGSNAPIILETDESLEDAKELFVALIQDDKVVKQWTKDDVMFLYGRTICPLTETETMGLMTGDIEIEVKWSDEYDNIYHARRFKTYVSRRDDRRMVNE